MKKKRRQRARRRYVRKETPVHYTDDTKSVRLDAEKRMAERDARQDDRTPAQIWLNEPPRWRSALG